MPILRLQDGVNANALLCGGSEVPSNSEVVHVGTQSDLVRDAFAEPGPSSPRTNLGEGGITRQLPAVIY
jgi:hypothetical protein